MTFVTASHELSSTEKDTIAQFRQALPVSTFKPVSWIDGIKVNLEMASSIDLQKGRNTLLAVMVLTEEVTGGATFGLPFVNPLRSYEESSAQMSHSSTVDRLKHTMGVPIGGYLSMYIWKTTCHTEKSPDMVGLCYGFSFCPPYQDQRRVHVERLAREIPYLRLFAAEYTYQKKSENANLTEFK